MRKSLISCGLCSLLAVFVAKANADYTLTTLAVFETAGIGYQPQGALAVDPGGNIYSTTPLGGSSGYGNLFKISAGSHAVSSVLNFQFTNGAVDIGGVVSDAAGNLYGATIQGPNYVGPRSAGYGTIFKVAAGATTYTTLATLDGTATDVQAPLAIDGTGTLYGIAQTTNTANQSTIFKLVPGAGTITPIANVTGITGAFNAGLTLDAAGDLFGVTQTGGTANQGTLFEIPAGTSTVNTIANFGAGNSAQDPLGKVLLDSHGDVFGTTFGGGSYGNGSIYEVPAGTSTVNILTSFETGAINPLNGVIADAAGDLFGTTPGGSGNGASAYGTVYELSAGSSTVTVLASFNDTNGSTPISNLYLDGAGNLFGTTYAGGDLTQQYGNGAGTVFELSPVPEPTSLTLLGMSGTALLGRRRKRSA